MNTSNSEQLLTTITSEIITPLYQVAVGVAFVYFVFGAAKYVIDLNKPDKKTFGRSHLLYGLIGLFIMLSVGGILNAFNSIFGNMFQ